MELDFIRWLRQQVPPHPKVPLGIGDDAALVQVSPGMVSVATTDMLMEDVDFLLDKAKSSQIGHKALAINLSDIAAMGAKPIAALVSVAIPSHLELKFVHAIYQGLLRLAQQFDVALAGGDTSVHDGPLVISVTLLGEVAAEKAWRRSGAKVGDKILVTGALGGSILGHHLDFTPRLAEAAWLAEHSQIHAAMDLSDGLALDLSRLVAESGCGGAVDLAKIPLSAASEKLAKQEAAKNSPHKKSALDHALSDGEDFELLLVVSTEEALRLLELQPLAVPLTEVGQIVAQPGLWQTAAGGQLLPLVAAGYQHGQSAPEPLELPSQLIPPQVESFMASSLAQTDQLGIALGQLLPDGTTVSLMGTLGAGKTRLAQAIALGCGVPQEQVTSPTFVLCQHYRGNRLLHHVDTYRLRDEDEFLDLGPEEWFYSAGITLVEWGDRVASSLPPNRLEITIEVVDEQTRLFILQPVGNFSRSLLREIVDQADA